MLAAGTTIVGGTNPKKAGTTLDFDGTSLPVFAGIAEAMGATGANVVVSFVPPAGAKIGMLEAIDAGIELAIVITEGIPVHDTTLAWAYATARGNAPRIVGPNCPGIASPGVSN